MIKIEGKITFQTILPISQETGLEMWSMGSYFHAVHSYGGRTYELTTSGETDDLQSGIAEIIDSIERAVSKDRTNEATVIKVSMETRF